MFFNELRTELVLKCYHEHVAVDAAARGCHFCNSDSAVAVKWSRKSKRHTLDVRAPWTQAFGPQAPRQKAPFIQNHSHLENTARTLALWNLWFISVKNATLCDSTGMLVNLRWQLRACWDRLNESRIIFNIAFVDEHTRSSQTYSGHYATPKAKPA